MATPVHLQIRQPMCAPRRPKSYSDATDDENNVTLYGPLYAHLCSLCTAANARQETQTQRRNIVRFRSCRICEVRTSCLLAEVFLVRVYTAFSRNKVEKLRIFMTDDA